MTRTTTGRSWRRISVLLAVTAAVLLGTATAAAADPTAGGDGDTVIIRDDDTTTDPTGPGNDGPAVIRIPKPYKEYRYIPACSANDVEGGADVLCGQAVSSCPREGDIRYRVYTRQHDADGSVAEGADWELLPGTQCRGPNDPDEGGPVVITTADIADEARKAAPATTVNVEPTTRSFVNVPNNFFADSASVEASVEVLGQTIGLTFAPNGFTWAFGDGTTGTGAGVQGAPVGAPGAVEHAYRRSGTVSVTLTRTFEVTYTAPGGVTGTIPGGVRNTSAPYALQVGEIQSLVTKVR
ncbi:hypothetical protein [Aeromicrobium wangtongii]|uniref:hypothetical protein n=1 Tax=Aeromicrobium wangtongii TaxID=2969247 RepID=UPI0020182D7A|nr:hypothetical protein [Aeromicrobium wangtongii]MCL3820184.1 hypothetical protein [Aeromicrobium wangtongii]